MMLKWMLLRTTIGGILIKKRIKIKIKIAKQEADKKLSKAAKKENRMK